MKQKARMSRSRKSTRGKGSLEKGCLFFRIIGQRNYANMNGE
jgi:hypothetical protein